MKKESILYLFIFIIFQFNTYTQDNSRNTLMERIEILKGILNCK